MVQETEGMSNDELEYEKLKRRYRYEFTGRRKPITDLQEEEDISSIFEGPWFLY
jgi:hypothetical protein